MYALLYLLLPLARAALLRLRNHAIAQRNAARGAVADAVAQEAAIHSPLAAKLACAAKHAGELKAQLAEAAPRR